jgi:hypothetical protein
VVAGRRAAGRRAGRVAGARFTTFVVGCFFFGFGLASGGFQPLGSSRQSLTCGTRTRTRER